MYLYICPIINKQKKQIMYKLIAECGLKVFAEYIDGIGWFDLDGYQIKDNIWISIEKIN